MAATIRDVAHAAHVAPSTVSRALNGSPLVSPDTRERVQQAATRLGYQPSRAARSLVTGSTGTIGMIVPDLSNPFFPGIVKGIQARARAAHLAVFVADSDEDQAAEVRLIRELAKQTDGLLLCSPRSSEDEIRDLAAATTIVLVNRRAHGLPAITVDNADGMRQAVAHLAALGHQRVGFVAGPAASWSGAQRLRGLRAAADAASVELAEVGNFPPQFEGGVAAADIVIAARLTAVIAYNDVIALGILSRLNARGVNVPAQISVVGCDDIVTARMSNPALSTVALPKEQAGRQAVDLLLDVMRNPDRRPSTQHTLPAHLIVRDSTGPAPQARRPANGAPR